MEAYEGPAPQVSALRAFLCAPCMQDGSRRTRDSVYGGARTRTCWVKSSSWSVLTDPNNNVARFLEQTFRDTSETALPQRVRGPGPDLPARPDAVAGPWLAAMFQEAIFPGRALSGLPCGPGDWHTHRVLAPGPDPGQCPATGKGTSTTPVGVRPLVPKATVSRA